jgi:hypothetical protein
VAPENTGVVRILLIYIIPKMDLAPIGPKIAANVSKGRGTTPINTVLRALITAAHLKGWLGTTMANPLYPMGGVPR